MMLKVGLTGNIGSGKSIVSEVFSVLGVPVYHADRESRKFLFDPVIKEKILRLFGEKVLSPSGEINRGALAAIVFSDDKALIALNLILHPLVIDDYTQWCETFPDHPYILHEAAIIFESGVAGIFDRIIHVSCPKEIAIERVRKRDGIDGNSILQRLRYQLDDAEKASRSDYVIRNDGTEMIIPQVLFIHGQLLQIGPERNDQVSTGTADA
jgi:dephospho-CoA kinase